MEQKLEILQGLPACGKSTYAIKKCKADPNWVRVCRDDLRTMRGTYWLPKQEDLITSWERNCVIGALRNGFNVVLDATNLNSRYLPQWKELVDATNEACDRDIKIEYKLFTDVSVEECIQRDKQREINGERSVGEKVIREFAQKYISYTETNEKVVQDSSLPHAIIVDIDGTVAVCGDRGHYDYHKVHLDSEHTHVAELVRPHIYGRGVTVIYVSGREDKCKEETKQWLIKNCLYIEKETQLHMRKTGDHRRDCIIKKEIFDEHIRNKYYVRFCIDDRTQVVQLWRSLGLLCLQVADGNF